MGEKEKEERYMPDILIQCLYLSRECVGKRWEEKKQDWCPYRSKIDENERKEKNDRVFQQRC